MIDARVAGLIGRADRSIVTGRLDPSLLPCSFGRGVGRRLVARLDVVLVGRVDVGLWSLTGRAERGGVKEAVRSRSRQ